ncbi:MAG: hypothetical protein HN576_14845 [Bacteriovoracaceae bacterium]|jgi:alginate O-acetyltransferase complex protein AlgI|nr:hypothetical protein [Bacteriovoracaceae bacterium]
MSESLESNNGVDYWLMAFAFDIRFYCDFSGYSDMAIGLASLMGIKLSKNFNFPYFATNPTDLWQRWHISLTRWLRDYIYKPIIEINNSKRIKIIALFTTLIFAGIWHGAHWKFIIWGILWASAILIHQILRPFINNLINNNHKKNFFLSALGMLTTFFVWNFINSFFIAKDITNAIAITKYMALDYSHSQRTYKDFVTVLYYTVPFLCIETYSWRKNTDTAILNISYPIRLCIIFFIILMLIGNGAMGENEFIYFKF